MAAVDLPAAVSRAFYEGYSNGTLWPLLHGFPGRATIDGASWDAYVEANRRFADAVVSSGCAPTTSSGSTTTS